MEYIAISFKSRSHTVGFSEFLTSNRIKNEIINTPKEAGVGCGLSVKTGTHVLAAVKKAVRITGYSSFAGCFLIKMHYGRRTVKSI